MSTTELMDMIEKLPEDKKQAVEKLVHTLSAETVSNLVNNEAIAKPDALTKERMHFGDLKGFVTYMAEDFDEPLEDFKDYM